MADTSIINAVRTANDPASTLNAQSAAQSVSALPAAPTGVAPPPAQAAPSTPTSSTTPPGSTTPPASGGTVPAPAPLPSATMPPPPPTPSVTLPTAPTAASYNPTTLPDPSKWSMTPDQTVQGQLANIMDPNSPIIQQARTQGLQLANDRGLLNSSMAEGEAMNSAYAAAMPIAQADAATAARAAGYNADELNQFAARNADAANQSGAFNANAANQMGQAQLSAQTQATIAQLQAQTQTNLAYLDHQTQTNLANLDTATRTNLATIEANYHVLMQSNASASDLFKQVTNNITAISMSKDMDGAAKQAAVDNQLQLLKSGMTVNGAVSNLNLGDLLNFTDMAPQTPGSVSGFTPNTGGGLGALVQDAAYKATHSQ